MARERLPAERNSITRAFRLVHNHKDGSQDLIHFYFTVGFYPDGRVGEIFIKADKGGSLASGALDAVAIMSSMLLQNGVPLETVIEKIKGTRYPPNGFTKDPEVQNCTSPLDLLARWLEIKFIKKELPNKG